ncbi:MAG: ABC transporter ATP-binding protein [Saprospiraceae bacterium]|nr:ABC transporter ATP-binding protein [Saprospiraceae bacterium]
MREFLPYLLRYRRYLFLAVFFHLLMSVFQVISIPALNFFLQILFKRKEDKTVVPVDTEAWNWYTRLEHNIAVFFDRQTLLYGQEAVLAGVCVLVVLIFFGKNISRYLGIYFMSPLRVGIIKDLRNQVHAKMLALPLSYYTEERKGDLMSRMTADISEIELSIIGMVEQLVKDPIAMAGALAIMVVMAPGLTLFVFVLMLFSGLLIGALGRSLRRRSNAAQTVLGYLMSLLEETLSGMRILKGFNASAWQQNRFEQVNDDYARKLIRISRRKDLASPLSEFLGICVVAVLLWYGSRLVFAGTLKPETFITFLFAFYNAIDPVKSLSTALYNVRKGRGALDRIQALLNAGIAIAEKATPAPLNGFRDKIAFENVGFRYQGGETDAVSDIHLVLERGKVVALVGASGAGKSTIADLLPRFYDPTKGRITLDGVDIREFTLEDLRGLMGIVSQDPVLFNDTVFSNIAFGKQGVTRQDVEEAARQANAHTFITELPEGYDTIIGDRGSKLSGGQRQRLTIARALLTQPQILILDEATSALDSESEKLVQEALERLLQNRTALVIAHRLSTVQHADVIVVMHQGRIVEQGTHISLMQDGRFYRKLVELQAL